MESSLLFPSLFFRQRLHALGISFLLGCFVLTVGKSGIGILSVSAVALFIGLMLLFFQDREGKITLLLLLVGLSVWLTWLLWKKVGIFELDHISEFQTRIDSFGAWGWLVALGIQVLQVIVALIPGEVVEVGCGMAFGTWGGLLICLAGSAIGSALIFLLVRKFGVKLVEVFVSREKINSLKFLSNERKLKSIIFLVFFTIGTPKDLLTYFAGLTNIKFYELAAEDYHRLGD